MTFDIPDTSRDKGTDKNEWAERKKEKKERGGETCVSHAARLISFELRLFRENVRQSSGATEAYTVIQLFEKKHVYIIRALAPVALHIRDVTEILFEFSALRYSGSIAAACAGKGR